VPKNSIKNTFEYAEFSIGYSTAMF
jgi:hypothetical protein